MRILKHCLTLALVLFTAFDTGIAQQNPPPNIVYILADDLGYGELGCYGQTKIRTPNIDALAKEGMRFTRHYSGSAVCAPSRCVLLTGKHTGQSFVRANTEGGGWGPNEPEGQTPIADQVLTIAEVLKTKGYQTAAIGKWGLGGPGSAGHPCFQGFDLFYGYLCQRVAHNYYPTHLWKNHDVDVLGNKYFAAHQKIKEPPAESTAWEKYSGDVYATDRMIEEAEQFVRQNKSKPFFLYYPTVVPHVAIQVPEDSLAEYEGEFEETPYLGSKGYLPHPQPRAAYAAMITRMDRNVGRIVSLLGELKLLENTLIIFSSDNGPTYAGGADSKFFNSSGPLRGLKGSLFEGGIRVPMIARWPGKIEAGSTSNHVSGFQDIFPTMCELVGVDVPADVNGLSMLPTLIGKTNDQKHHECMYWELRNKQAVLCGDWKMYRVSNKAGEIKSHLFNLKSDPSEMKNLVESEPEQMNRLIQAAKKSRQKSELFPSPFESTTD